MHVLTVLYAHPQDPQAFDDHYQSVHRPLVDKIPGLQSFSVRHCVALDGSQAPYYLIAELNFASAEDLASGMRSPEGKATAQDVPNFGGAGVTMMVAHD